MRADVAILTTIANRRGEQRCNAFASSGLRRPDGSGTVWPKRCANHDDLHARAESGRQGRPKPCGPRLKSHGDLRVVESVWNATHGRGLPTHLVNRSCVRAFPTENAVGLIQNDAACIKDLCGTTYSGRQTHHIDPGI